MRESPGSGGPRKLDPSLPPRRKEIVLRALQRDPAARYPTASAMKGELDTAEHVRVTGLADRLQEPAASPPGWFQQPRMVAAAMLVPLAIGILIMTCLLLRRHAG